MGPLTKGLPPPDPHSLCRLSSAEFVESPPQYATALHDDDLMNSGTDFLKFYVGRIE
jgi:hypothetical protein